MNKAKKQVAKKRGRDSESRKQPGLSSPGFSLSFWLAIIVAAVAFLVYANTLNHKYALDDYSLIIENTVTQKGAAAIPEIFKTGYRSGYHSIDVQLYRPLSKAMFAIEWQLAPNKPALGHWVNVLLFSLTCFVLFYALLLYLKEATFSRRDGQNMRVGTTASESVTATLIAFIAAILFATHPLHTEVVANIKSRDEILSLLFVLLSSIGVYKYLKSNSFFFLLLAALSFFIALFSKESAITFLAVIPLMVYFFTDFKTSKNITAAFALGAVTLIFLLIRRSILVGGVASVPMIDNYLYGIKDIVSQRATAVFLMGIYLKLLFFPHPLVADGSYNHFPMVTAADWRFLISAVIYLALIIYAIMGLKKKNIFSFSILYFLITASITSNVIFLIGTDYGERLMFTPSLGFCLAAAVLIVRLIRNKNATALNSVPAFLKSNSKAIIITGVILVLYSVKTIARNYAWTDNQTLYEQCVIDAPNSARSHYYLGNQLTLDDFLRTVTDSVEKEKYILRGVSEINKAIEIYPDYADAYSKLGKIYMDKKDYKKSEPYYLKALELNPTNSTYLNNYGNLLFNTGRYPEAKEKLELAVKYNPYYAHALSNLASVYGTYGENYAIRAEQDKKSNNMESAKQNNDAAVESFNNAITYFQKAIKQDPGFAQPYYMIGVTYRKLGDEQNANYYIGLFEKMKK